MNIVKHCLHVCLVLVVEVPPEQVVVAEALAALAAPPHLVLLAPDLGVLLLVVGQVVLVGGLLQEPDVAQLAVELVLIKLLLLLGIRPSSGSGPSSTFLGTLFGHGHRHLLYSSAFSLRSVRCIVLILIVLILDSDNLIAISAGGLCIRDSSWRPRWRWRGRGWAGHQEVEGRGRDDGDWGQGGESPLDVLR